MPTPTRTPPALTLERLHAPPRAVPPSREWESRSSTARGPDTTYARYGRPALRAALLLTCLPPALLLALPIAVLNALAFGNLRSVLFLQDRVGRHGRVFRMVKFRTLRPRSGTYTDAPGESDDARVTPFGRFLRRTHLDELPQLWNVLWGEMDFIGPRPEMLSIDEWARRKVPGFRARSAVLPGVTGLAQVTQGYAPRERRAYRRKLALDRLYMARFSASLDCVILARTALWMLRGRGWRRRSPDATRT